MRNPGNWITLLYAILFGAIAPEVLDSPGNWGVRWRLEVFVFSAGGVLAALFVVTFVQGVGAQDARSSRIRLAAFSFCALVLVIGALLFDRGEAGPLRAWAPFYGVVFGIAMLASIVAEGAKRIVAISLERPDKSTKNESPMQFRSTRISGAGQENGEPAGQESQSKPVAPKEQKPPD